MIWPGKQAKLAWTDPSGTDYTLSFDLILSEGWEEGATVTEHPVETGADVADHVRVTLPKCELKVFSTDEPVDNGGPDNLHPTRGPLTLNVPSVSYSKSTPAPLVVQTWKNMILERALAGTAGGLVGNAIGGQVGGAIGAIAVASLFDGHEEDKSVQTSAGLGDLALGTQNVATLVYQWPNETDFVEATHALLVQLKNAAQSIDVYGSKQTEFGMVIETLAFHRDADTGTGEEITIAFKKVRVVATQTVPLPIPNQSAGGGNDTVDRGHQEAAPAPTQQSQSALSKIGDAIDAAGGITAFLGF